MQQMITAKLKLAPTKEQFEALRQTQLAYRDGLNAVSQYAFEQGKISTVTKLHKGMYAQLRARYHLPKPLACSAERQVSATYKGRWTKLKKNAEHRRAKITKKRFQGLDQPPHDSSPMVQCYLLVSLTIDLPEPTWEHLTDIRERTRRKKRTRKKHGKGDEQVSEKARKANRVYSQWSFAELHDLISYTAALAGSLAIKVDADYTSKACPMCGHTADENRPRKGLLFVCQNPRCRYGLHADLIGARNVTLRALLVRQDWIGTGCLSTIPDASGGFAKAARLSRYAELRWSPEVTTSLRLEAGGR
jgi:IS605 OrfB family transposase